MPEFCTASDQICCEFSHGDFIFIGECGGAVQYIVDRINPALPADAVYTAHDAENRAEIAAVAVCITAGQQTDFHGVAEYPVPVEQRRYDMRSTAGGSTVIVGILDHPAAQLPVIWMPAVKIGDSAHHCSVFRIRINQIQRSPDDLLRVIGIECFCDTGTDESGSETSLAGVHHAGKRFRTFRCRCRLSGKNQPGGIEKNLSADKIGTVAGSRNRLPVQPVMIGSDFL